MRLLSQETLLFGILLIPYIIQGAPSSSKNVARCSRTECLNPTKFRYTPGKTYRYRYEVDIASSVDNTANGDESRIHMTAKVHLDVHSPCDWTLKINEVTLQDSEPSDTTRKTAVTGESIFKQAIEQHDMAFAFDDGQISHICPSPDEPAWIVNIKRGILSAFQNTMARFDLDHRTVETDVAGTCEITYSFNGAETNSVKVLKTRDLTSCSNRYGVFNSLPVVPYRFLGENKDSMQLANSTSSCEQKITGHRITRVDCEEKHVVRPFSYEGAGAFTSMRQSLEFIEDLPLDDEDSTSSAELKTPAKTSLLFHHYRTRGSLTVSDLPATLQQLCQHIEDGVDVEAASIYESLTNVLRSMDYSSLSAVMSDSDAICREEKAARRLLVNGLITVASSDAISILVEEASTGRLEPDLLNRWITSLAFITRPTEKHLAAALPLLDMAPPSRPVNAALSISSMARKISSKGRSVEASILVNKLSQHLGTSCQTRSREEREEAVIALKSLANVADSIHGDHLTMVKACALEKDNPAEIRVAALQTLRNVPCKEDVQTPMKIFKDSNEDSEIRIASYLVAMKCPSFQRVVDIKRLLHTEEVNQVGSFVWTHLRNLASSAMPSKLDLQALILDQDLVKKFNLDARKFSRNYEASVFLDQFNAALGLEGNIIFSQQSYLPRTASLNFTVDIFGQSVNIFEVDGRFEGFERYVESLFSPGGVYHQKEIGHILRSLRPKRKAQPMGLSTSKLEAIDKQFDAKSRFDDEPELSLSTKFLGSDISYRHFEGHKEIEAALQSVNPITKLHKMLNTEEESHFSFASQYVDSTYVIPLSVGLPLNLVARGQVIADLRGALKTDLKSLIQSGKGDVSWKLHPSAAVSFDASMSVDAVVASAGVKLAATLHTSVSTSGKIAIDGLRLIDIQVDLPQEKAEIMNVKSEILLHHRNTKTPLSGVAENREEMSRCTRGPTQRFFGLQLCTQLSYPNTSETEFGPFFPLTGSSNLNIELVKIDPSISSYHFLHKIDVSETLRSWTFTFTPEGSKSTKEMGLKTKLEYNNLDSGLFGFSLMLPSNTYEAKGNFNWNNDSKVIEASFLKDGNHEILVAKGSLNHITRAKQQVYQPKLVLTLNNKNIVDLNGEMKLLEKKGILKYDVDLQAKMGPWLTGTKGYFLLDEKSQISNLTVEYKANPKARSEKIRIEAKVNNGSSHSLRQYDLHLFVEPSAFPNRNFMGSWRFEQGAEHVQNILTLHTGSAPRTLENSLTIKQKFAYAAGPAQQDLKFRNQLEISLPARNIDFAFVIGHEQNDYITDTLFVGRYAPEKEVRLGVMLNKQPGILFKADGALNLTLPGQPIVNVEAIIQEDSRNHYKVDMNGIIGRETDFKLAGTYVDLINAVTSSQDLKFSVTGTTILPIDLAYSRQLNQSIYEAQFQSSYGKDAISLYFAKENPSQDEVKFTSKVGYLAFLHSIESSWKSQADGKKGTLDVHVDKVLDISSDFSSDVAINGRREVSLNFRWDANRNPLQKISAKMSYEPSELSKNDWNSAIHVTYPGSYVKANAAALTQKNNRTISGKVELGQNKLITFSSDTMRMRDILWSQLEVSTPFAGWNKSKLMFVTQTKNKQHKTEMNVVFGENHFFDGLILAALERNSELKSAEANISIASSFDRFERFTVGARTELTPKSLNNSIKFQWAKDQELGITSNLEWSFDGQVLMKSETYLATPFPQIGQAKLELYHNTEWESSQLSETQTSLTINGQLYSLLLRGESPSATKRWEVTGVLTTPHPHYSRIGLSTLYSGDETRPTFDMNFSWPEKEVALLLTSETLPDGKRGIAHLKTPLQQLRNLSIDTFISTQFDEHSLQFDIGTRWNAIEYVTLNTSWIMESAANASLNVDLRTSFKEHDHYGTRMSLAYDLSEFPSLNAIMRIAIPGSKGIGLTTNGSMMKPNDEDELLVAGTILLEVARYTEIKVEIGHERKMTGDFKTDVLCAMGEDNIKLNFETSTTDDGHFVASLKTRLPLEQLSEAELKARFLKEYLNDPTTEFLAEVMLKWKEYGQENKAGLRLNYLEVFEELEDFSQKSSTTFEASVRSPWSPVQRLSVKGKQAAHGANMEHSIEALYNDQTYNLNGSVDFGAESATMLLVRKLPGQPKPLSIRMNTTWSVLDEQIQVSGVVATSMQGFNRIPWKVTVTVRDSEEDENDWERQIQGEAQFSKTQHALFSASYLPTKFNADVVTPFESFKTVNLTVDYERPTESSITGAAELRINDDLVEITSSYDWPFDNTLPLELQFSMSSPFKYEVALLNWKTEDPLVSAEFSASLKGKPVSFSTEGSYNFASLDNFKTQVKFEKSVEDQVDAGKLDVAFENTPESVTGTFKLSTPFDQLKNFDSSLSAIYETKNYKGSIGLETAVISGKVHAHYEGDSDTPNADLQVKIDDVCQLAVKSSMDTEYKKIDLDASISWDEDRAKWGVQSQFQRDEWSKYDWHTEITSTDPYKWLLDLNLDFKDIKKLYNHNISYKAVHDDVGYGTFGNLVTEGNAYRGTVGIDIGSANPVQLRFVNKKLDRKLGNMLVEILTPWTEDPSLTITVDVDERTKPVQYKVTAIATDKIVYISSNLKFRSLSSLSANTQVTSTLSWVPDTSFDLGIHTTDNSFNGSYALTWSENNVDLLVFHEEVELADRVSILDRKNIHGAIQLKTSWERVPEASVRYSRDFTSTTACDTIVKLSHNFSEVVNFVYKTNERSSAGREVKEGILEMRGAALTGAMAFTSDFQYSAGQDGDNLPRSLTRVLEVYKIGQRANFKLRAELMEKETFTGQEYAVKVSSPMRTVEFSTHTDQPEGIFRHGSEFRWRPNERIAYEIEIENKTTTTTTDYVMTTKLITPVRSVGLTGTLRQTKRNLRAVGELLWDLKRRESLARVTLTWENTTKTPTVASHRVRIGFSQGTLPQELVLLTEVQRSTLHPINIQSKIQYSNDPRQHVDINAIVTVRKGIYRAELNATHPSTGLEMRKVVSFERNGSGGIQISHLFSHSRTDVELLVLEHLFTFDPVDKKLFFTASSPTFTLRHQGQLNKKGNHSKITYEIQQDEFTPRHAELDIDHSLPFGNLVVHYDPEKLQALHIKTGMLDKRQIIFDLFSMDDKEFEPFFDFAFRLNHSHLITSHARWPLDYQVRLLDAATRARNSLKTTGAQWYDAFLKQPLVEARDSSYIIAEDVLKVLDVAWLNFIDELDKLKADAGIMKQNIIDGYNSNAFYAKLAVDIGGAIIRDIPFDSYAQNLLAFIEKTGNRILAPITGEEDSFSEWLRKASQTLSAFADAISTWMGKQWNWPSENTSKVLDQIMAIFRQMAEEYDRFVQQLQTSIMETFRSFRTPLRNLVQDSCYGLYNSLRPLVLRAAMEIENACWNVMKEVLDYFYEQRHAVVKSNYFQKLALLVEDVKQFYLDMQSIDWPSNIQKYAKKAAQFLQQKYADIDDYLVWLETLKTEWYAIYQAFLRENPEIQKGIENGEQFAAFLKWSYNYLQVNKKIPELLSAVREHGLETLRQTATEAKTRYAVQKTKLRMNPELGLIELEQKLPFPWISFDERPKFEELPEVKRIRSFVQMFQSSDTSTVDELLSYLPRETHLFEFMPPFKSSAHLFGLQHFKTFDGRHYEFVGPCTYLLSRDLLTKNFTLAVQYASQRGKPYAAILKLILDDVQWDLDLANHTVRMAGVSQTLPVVNGHTHAFYDHGKFVIDSSNRGVRLECIASYEVCTFTVSGWYNNKVGGMMGTIDHEPSNDLILPNHIVELDLPSLARSWDVSTKEDCKTTENMAKKIAPSDDKQLESCNILFFGARSTVRHCHPTVDAAPYVQMCTAKPRKPGVPEGCHAAAAYVEACAAAGVSVRIPPQCIRCQVENDYLSESESREFVQDKTHRPSSDVVLILETRKCNEPDVQARRFLPSLITSLEQELNQQKIIKNRFSLVTYGGAAPFDTPKVRTVYGQEFVTAKEMQNLLASLRYDESGSTLPTDALRFASQLTFRPGVSKTFILVPCSTCGESHGHRISARSLVDRDITLHILTDAEFRFSKPNASKQFLGLDAKTGYTPKEFKGRIVGDADLRRQSKLPRSAIGVCASLALETNGTIFSVRRLREQASQSKRAINIWAKRVASSAPPSDCQKCLCTLKNYYQSTLDCRTCGARDVHPVDMSFLVDEATISRIGKNMKARGKDDEKQTQPDATLTEEA